MRKQEQKAMSDRLQKVLKADPGVTNAQLKQRFGCGNFVINRVRDEMNIHADHNPYLSKADLAKMNVKFTEGQSSRIDYRNVKHRSK